MPDMGDALFEQCERVAATEILKRLAAAGYITPGQAGEKLGMTEQKFLDYKTDLSDIRVDYDPSFPPSLEMEGKNAVENIYIMGDLQRKIIWDGLAYGKIMMRHRLAEEGLIMVKDAMDWTYLDLGEFINFPERVKKENGSGESGLALFLLRAGEAGACEELVKAGILSRKEALSRMGVTKRQYQIYLDAFRNRK